MTLLYAFPRLIPGRLVCRYKRFFADVELADGSLVTAHCPNTGTMSNISTPGSTVWLSNSNNPTRKLAYTWELIETDGVCVGVNTAQPNRVVLEGLRKRVFEELAPYNAVQREVRYGAENSRIDFLLDRDGMPPLYLEIKNTTWAMPLHGTRQARFPDCVTTRGQKHLRELTRVSALGGCSAVMFFVNRADCTSFKPGDTTDPVYGQLLRQAWLGGVLVLPCAFDVTPEGITYRGVLPLDLS